MSIDLSTTNPITVSRPRIDLEILSRSNIKQESGGATNANPANSSSEDTNPSNENPVNTSRPVADSSNPVNIEDNTDSVTKARVQDMERNIINELEKRDREVRSHEQAHKATAGRFAAGGATFTLERGPDGKFFAVAGHVNLDVSEESTPEKTIQKMRVIRKAALAPAQPSAQDRAVAAEATAKEAEARRELMQEKAEKGNEVNPSKGRNRSSSIKFIQNMGDISIAGAGGSEFTRLEGSFIDTFI